MSRRRDACSVDFRQESPEDHRTCFVADQHRLSKFTSHTASYCDMCSLLFVFVAILSLLPVGFASSNNNKLPSRVTKEYCNMELFNATCPPGEVLMIDNARYGRMSIGQCVRKSYGYLGCAADVRRFMDGRCAGRRTCAFVVPDPVLYSMHPCPGDFTSYLETTHSCVQVQYSNRTMCDRHRAVKSTASSGYFTSSAAEERGPGSALCPWTIEAQRGQRINVTLFNFVDVASTVDKTTAGSGSAAAAADGAARPPGYGPMRPDVCFEIAVVSDGTSKKTVTVCGEDRREVAVIWSRSNVVQIELTNPKLLQSLGAFVFYFRVTGCPEIKLNGDMWLQQLQPFDASVDHHADILSASSHQNMYLTSSSSLQQQVAVLRCNATEEEWRITCLDSTWTGEIGNCTSKAGWSLEHMIHQDNAFPLGVLLAVAIGVAMGVVIGGVMLCLLTMYMKRHRLSGNAPGGYSQPKEQHMFVSYPSPTQTASYRGGLAGDLGSVSYSSSAGTTTGTTYGCRGGGSLHHQQQQQQFDSQSRTTSNCSAVSALLTCSSGVLRHHAVTSSCDDVIATTTMQDDVTSSSFGGGVGFDSAVLMSRVASSCGGPGSVVGGQCGRVQVTGGGVFLPKSYVGGPTVVQSLT